jgi:hypothetical protein
MIHQAEKIATTRSIDITLNNNTTADCNDNTVRSKKVILITGRGGL